MSRVATIVKSKKLTKKPSSGDDAIILNVFGFEGCGYYIAALEKLKSYKRDHKIIVNTQCVNRILWPRIIQTYATDRGIQHTTSPLIFANGKYIGGHDSLVHELRKSKPFA